MITWDAVEARHKRLSELARGLAKESVIIAEGNDVLLYLERKAYLAALHQALHGVEGARIALATARHRMKEQNELPPDPAQERPSWFRP